MQNKKQAIITTKRLTLHPFDQNDEQRMIEMLTHPHVYKTYLVPEYNSQEEYVQLFERFKQLSLDGERFVYGVYLNGRLIGWVNEVQKQNDQIELGLVIHPSFNNMGFGTEVLGACIEQLFSMGFAVVKTGAFEQNVASIRVMQKCNMKMLCERERIEYRGAVYSCVTFEKRK